MFEAIKSLNPKQRLAAFIIAVILTSLVTVLVSYLKTDDCIEMSNQYNALVKNQAELMSINNDLLEKNNDKQRDLMKLNEFLEAMTQTQTQKTEQTTIRSIPSSAQTSFIQDLSDSCVVVAEAKVSQYPATVTHEKTKIIKETFSPTYKNILDSCVFIAKKYKE